jgi:hypothetical protein
MSDYEFVRNRRLASTLPFEASKQKSPVGGPTPTLPKLKNPPQTTNPKEPLSEYHRPKPNQKKPR